MIFTSLEYLIFLPIVFAVFWATPHQHRWVFLLVVSYVFYMFWRAEYALIMLTLTIVDYFAGIGIANAATQSSRRLWLAGSIVANLSMLFFFKYYNFAATEASALLHKFGSDLRIPFADIILPLGISFHTFQAMGYTLDIYHNRIKPEKHIGYFALFIAYFPQIVAGPIERAGHLLVQLHEKQHFSYERAREGFFLILLGFFKKLVIADNLAVYVDQCYGSWSSMRGASLLLATYAFAFQIYADFSGYTDIARGSAKLLGVDLVINFRMPYLADSVGEFWRRWHISLTSWFRDYVYKPLLATPQKCSRTAAVFIVFLLSGIWHGANRTFVAWALLNALFYFLNEKAIALKPSWFSSQKLRPLRVFITFNLIAITWVFFRAASISSALGILRRILGYILGVGGDGIWVEIGGNGIWVEESIGFLWVGMFAGALILIAERIQQSSPSIVLRAMNRGSLRWASYFFLAYSTILLGNLGAKQFIYFQF
jgi:D-alanyl-lipoteichoic acid acyltransferase DltB (MBOAT superfamily)